ncbi:MAG: hypothetical protein KGH89_06415 [Thaumarchaeota archaeon]|nr:hypothetical protein [Nitrososphaerota archaeon]MDE1867117.1 hypothetical protein [Nitrososphaerota archaeon]
MVNLGPAKLAGIITVVGIVAISGTNLAFAQQPCGEQAYGYIGCTPLATAQQYAVIMVVGVVACAIAFGAAGRQYHTIP